MHTLGVEVDSLGQHLSKRVQVSGAVRFKLVEQTLDRASPAGLEVRESVEALELRPPFSEDDLVLSP